MESHRPLFLTARSFEAISNADLSTQSVYRDGAELDLFFQGATIGAKRR